MDLVQLTKYTDSDFFLLGIEAHALWLSVSSADSFWEISSFVGFESSP